MKKKVSVLLLAMGMVSIPLTAKPSSNHQSQTDNVSNQQKRVASTIKRLSRKKAEMEFIRESNEEINKALNLNTYSSNRQETLKVVIAPKTILTTAMPREGIDISDEFKRLQGKSKSS